MNDRIRVLQVLTSLGGVGGIQDYVANLVTGMDRSRFEPEVACGPGEGVFVERVRAAGIPIHRLRFVRDIRPWTDLCGLADIVRLLRGRRYDVVHAHMSKAAFLARLAARSAGVPLVVFAGHNFGSIYFRGTAVAPLFWLVDKVMCAAFTDVVISVAEYMRSEVIRLRMVAPSKVVTVLSGIDLARFDAQSRSADDGADWPGDGPVVGVVARLSPEKGLLTLVAAADRVIAAVPAARFVIAGDGPQRAALEQAVHAAGLGHRFSFLGARRDVPRLLGRFDVFVLPSRSEGLPIALMEAMAAGRAAVASEVGGVGELIAAGDTGLLVPAGNADALAEALVRLLRDGALRQRLGANARRAVEAKFALERMVREIEAVYLSHLSRRGRA